MECRRQQTARRHARWRQHSTARRRVVWRQHEMDRVLLPPNHGEHTTADPTPGEET